MSRIHQKGPARIEANLTAFIDVTFLLIIFFILVAQITTAEHLPVDLPRITDRASAPADREETLVVNCLPAGDGVKYSIAGREYTSDNAARELSDLFRREHKRQPDINITVRAHRLLAYRFVYPVLDAARRAGVKKVDLVILPPEGGA